MADATRKLATIVALDVAGYSARVEMDEAKTAEEIAALRKVIEAIAARHGGRVFNTAGDGFMLEFASSLLAVEAAFELAGTCEPKVRVGVHLGDVAVQPNGDLLGHGVNVAARLMALAPPGSVLISADVKRMMHGPLAQTLRSKGTVKLAKMSETIEVFTFLPEAAPPRDMRARVAHMWARTTSGVSQRVALVAGAVAIAAAAVAATLMAPSLSPQDEAPIASIAVLPFENLSSQKDAAFFAVGIQDEILTRLAKIGSLKVISRTSTSQLKSRPDNLRELARQLGVANVLEGSVQREGDAVRINVQLIKASTDGHLWAEIYDRKLDNIFGVQSEIAVAIAAALNATVTAEEKRAIAARATSVPAAYDAYLRGIALMQERRGATQAAPFFKQAVDLDPQFALAWAYSARLAAQSYGWREATEVQRALARSSLDTALRLDPTLPEVQLAQGFYMLHVEQAYASARQQFEKVHAKWPNEIEGFLALGSVARRQGQWDESRALYERAIALDPLRPDLRSNLISVLVQTRDLDAASRAVDEALTRWPREASFIAEKANILQRRGLIAEAGALLKPLRMRSEPYIWRRIVTQALYERRFGDAIDVLVRLAAQKPDTFTMAQLTLDLGHLRGLAGDAAGAAKDLAQARSLLAVEYLRQPKNASVLGALALTFGYLGESKRGLEYAQMAIASSSSAGSRFDDIQMRILAFAGERERAMGALERLQSMPSGSYTPAMLRLDPIFDKLRGEPRFEALAVEGANTN